MKTMKIKKSEQRELDRLHEEVRKDFTIESMLLHGEYIRMLIEDRTDDVDAKIEVNFLMLQLLDGRASSYFRLRQLFNSLT